MAIEHYKGFNTYIIYEEETVFGTPAAPIAGNKIGKITSFSWNGTNNNFRFQSMGDGRNATSAIQGSFDVSGSIDFDVEDFTALQYAVGTIQGNGGVATPFELVEVDDIGYAGATEIPTLSLEVGSEGDANDDVMIFDGVVFNSLTIGASAGERMTASIDWIGRSLATSTALEVYTASTNKVFVFQDATVAVGSDVCSCTAFSFTINNNISTFREIGDRFIQQPVSGLRRYEFSITLKKKFDSTAGILSATELRDLFFGASAAPSDTGAVTAFTVSLDIAEGSGTAGERVVNIDLETCYFESWSEPISLDGGVIEVTVNGFGLNGLADAADNVPIRWYTIV